MRKSRFLLWVTLIFTKVASLPALEEKCDGYVDHFNIEASKDEGITSPPPAAFSLNELSTFIPQIPKVNVVTGEYCEEECDLVIAGIEPLSYRRFYEHNGCTYLPIHDIQGSLATMISTNGKPHSTYRYTAFGEQLKGNNSSPWRFASKRYDAETDFIYFGRRYYSSNLGRWITADPQGFDDGPNLYAYLSNDPMTDCDPYGLWSARGAYTNAQYFMWGMLEGSAYHFSNMASSFCMRDCSSSNWEPRSLMSHQNEAPARGLNGIEHACLPFTYEARRLGNDVSSLDHMRARGRALGEQAVTFGGLFSSLGAAKRLLNSGTALQKTFVPVQELSREYLLSGKPKITESSHIFKNELGARSNLNLIPEQFFSSKTYSEMKNLLTN